MLTDFFETCVSFALENILNGVFEKCVCSSTAAGSVRFQGLQEASVVVLHVQEMTTLRHLVYLEDWICWTSFWREASLGEGDKHVYTSNKKSYITWKQNSVKLAKCKAYCLSLSVVQSMKDLWKWHVTGSQFESLLFSHNLSLLCIYLALNNCIWLVFCVWINVEIFQFDTVLFY